MTVCRFFLVMVCTRVVSGLEQADPATPALQLTTSGPATLNHAHKLQNARSVPDNPVSYSQLGEDRATNARYFKNATHGAYVEMGAFDGVIYSNTKYFEDHFQWQGLLIEANPAMYEKLVQNRPNSISVNAAICSHQRTVHYVAGPDGALAGIWEFMSQEFRQHWYGDSHLMPSYAVPIKCVPLHTLLSRHGITHVDLFSLDVEGAELEVLRTFDFAQVHVKVWVIELDGTDNMKDDEVRALLASHGYIYDKQSTEMGLPINEWFYHKELRRDDDSFVMP